MARLTLLRTADIRTITFVGMRPPGPFAIRGRRGGRKLTRKLRDSRTGNRVGREQPSVAILSGKGKVPPTPRHGVYDHTEGTRTQRPLIPMRTAGTDVYDSRLRPVT